MKLNVGTFSIAQTVTAAILYAIGSFFVGFLTDTAASLAGYALHVNPFGIMRPVDLPGFINGLLVVSFGWGLLSLLAAVVYNNLAQKPSYK